MVTKEYFLEFLEQGNVINNIKRKNNKYSINQSDYLSISSLVNYFYRAFNLLIDESTMQIALNEVCQDESIRERDIRDKLARELSGTIEVKVESGSIDVVTQDEIIEVKKACDWKHAIGQILCYSPYFPEKQKRVHLFGKFSKGSFDECFQICKNNKIKLTYESL